MFRISLLLLGLVGAGVAVVTAASADLDRELILTFLAGESSEDAAIARWQERARHADATRQVFERLAWAYVAKARRTQDAGFYKLAEKTVDVIEAHFGADDASALVRGHVLHNLHRFREAEVIARHLVDQRGLPVDFALLSDVLVEQGKLDEGVVALQRLAELKPGMEASSRIAHVRWLKGDLGGAITAMESALAAADGRETETWAWLATRLAGFHLQRGDPTGALELADRALARAVDYPPALLTRGRTLLALARVPEALESLRKAEGLQPLPEYQWWLADALAVAGRRDEAEVVEQRLKKHGAETDPRTFALFLATRAEDTGRALRLARAELKERADPLSHDALAWALAANGEWEQSTTEIGFALAEGTNDARLRLHAGRIALQRGEQAAAADAFARAAAGADTLTPSERAMLGRSMAHARELALR